MAITTIDDKYLSNIATAIRQKSGVEDTFKPSEMASAIKNISGSEDLTSEFNTYETHLNTQENSIEDIFDLLQQKSSVTSTETWTLTMSDNSIVTKEVVVL